LRVVGCAGGAGKDDPAPGRRTPRSRLQPRPRDRPEDAARQPGPPGRARARLSARLRGLMAARGGSNAVATSDSLWASVDAGRWRADLERYAAVVDAQDVRRLSELDRWYRQDLPVVLAGRAEPYVTRDELVRVTEWKMARGVWRQRNLFLVRSNEADLIERRSREALARVPDPTAPIATLTKLAGVGPATASAVAAAVAPATYPFFDDLVAGQVPDLGPVDFTLKY